MVRDLGCAWQPPPRSFDQDLMNSSTAQRFGSAPVVQDRDGEYGAAGVCELSAVTTPLGQPDACPVAGRNLLRMLEGDIFVGDTVNEKNRHWTPVMKDNYISYGTVNVIVVHQPQLHPGTRHRKDSSVLHTQCLRLAANSPQPMQARAAH